MTALPVNAVINTCRCCGTPYDTDTFAKLKLCGTKGYVFGGTKVTEIYRHCECGSTLMVFVETPSRADS